MKLLRDTSLIYRRSMKQTLRQPVWVAIGLLQPLMFLFLFGPLLEQVVRAPGFPQGGAWNVFVPGLLVQIALFAGVFAGFGLVAQIRTGVLERFRVTPVSRTALLFGFALRDTTILVVQALLLIAIAIPLGLHIDAAGVAITILLLALVGLALGSGSYVIALATKSEEALAPITNTISMPLLLLSGVLLPMALAPVWLQTIATANPLLHAVDAVRAVFVGHPGDPAVGFGLGLFAVLAAVGLWGAGRMFGRTVS
jgi:ABC-2 type transport system permease protein